MRTARSNQPVIWRDVVDDLRVAREADPLVDWDSSKVRYRAKVSDEGILVRAYYGRKRVGWMSAIPKSYPENNDTLCDDDVRALVDRHPHLVVREWQRSDGSVWRQIPTLVVFKAFLEDGEYHGKGIGKGMYEAVMREWYKKGGPFVFIPFYCTIGSGTSPMAKRVWDSLARRFPSVGHAVAVLKTPKVASADCPTKGLSFAWVSPKGVVHETSGPGHERWAESTIRSSKSMYRRFRKAFGDPYDDEFHWFESPWSDFLLQDGWVRVVNLLNVEVRQGTTTSAALASVADLIVGCVLSDRRIEPDMVMRVDGHRPSRLTVADAVKMWGGQKDEDRMFGGLLARTSSSSRVATAITRTTKLAGEREMTSSTTKRVAARRLAASRIKVYPDGRVMAYSIIYTPDDPEQFVEDVEAILALPLRLTRKDYERLARKYGVKVYDDSEMGDYGDRYGNYDFEHYFMKRRNRKIGWELTLKQHRWYGLKASKQTPQKTASEDPVRPYATRGQVKAMVTFPVGVGDVVDVMLGGNVVSMQVARVRSHEVTDDDPSFRGSHLMGWEGSYVQDIELSPVGVRTAKDLPKNVERYVQEGKDQGLDEGEAWAVAWSRYCVAGDTYIHTSMGMMTVADLEARAAGRRIVHGDGVVAKEVATRVASHNGVAETSHVINTGVKPVVRVKTKHGFTLTCTPDHKLLALNTDDYSTEWVEAGQCEGRYLVLPTHGLCGTQTMLPKAEYTPKVWNNVVPLRQPTEMTYDLARVLGYLVSEGSITQEGVEFSNTDPQVVEDYTRCMTSLFGEAPKVIWLEPNESHRRVTRAAKVRSRTRWYREFFSALGLTPGVAQDKEIPHAILNAPKRFVVEFLRSFIEGDGFTGDDAHKNRVDLATSSHALARQLHLVLANLGVLGTLEQTRRGYYNVRIHSAPMVRRFVDVVGGGVFKKVALNESRKRLRGSEFECVPASGITSLHKAIANRFPGSSRVSLSRVFRNWGVLEAHAGGNVILDNLRDLRDQGYLFDPASVEPAGEAEVYDITVPGDSSFVADGLLAHNCKYKNPDSPHCKKDSPSDYLQNQGKKQASEALPFDRFYKSSDAARARRVASRYMRVKHPDISHKA